MNYLAHFYLSYPDKKMMVGNFIADQVKGKAFEALSEPVAKGVIHHREIDAFTDRHPIVKQAKRRMFDEYRHFSGVILDMFYDFFLASNWGQYAVLSLEEFSEECYQCMHDNLHEMPAASQKIIRHMSTQDWLVHYRTIPGIGEALGGISRRSTFSNHIEQSVILLEQYQEVYKQEFFDFFDELCQALKIS